MFFVVLCPGTPEGSTGSGLVLKRLRRRGNGLKSHQTDHTGQCKRTGGCYNELVVAFFSTGGGVKGKKNQYLLT